ncbi:hypothetical protein [Pseudomonas meliae]|uniref:Uncharacterized protein n=1 Tax=Pseudomonas meliae TaxID=86176 RepID=A0A0P9UDF8_9PSED|nr:hypothetical protein [Pseudomonas meliae]KPX86330.1 hypothetical protein ALO64_200111 [Pseudomonas meliae]
MIYLTWVIVCFYRGLAFSIAGMALAFLLSADPATATFSEFLTFFQDKAVHWLIFLMAGFIGVGLLVFRSAGNHNPYGVHARMGGAAASDSKPIEAEQQP